MHGPNDSDSPPRYDVDNDERSFSAASDDDWEGINAGNYKFSPNTETFWPTHSANDGLEVE